MHEDQGPKVPRIGLVAMDEALRICTGAASDGEGEEDGEIDDLEFDALIRGMEGGCEDARDSWASGPRGLNESDECIESLLADTSDLHLLTQSLEVPRLPLGLIKAQNL